MEELGAGYCPWGCKESGTTERLHFTFSVRKYNKLCGWQKPTQYCKAIILQLKINKFIFKKKNATQNSVCMCIT